MPMAPQAICKFPTRGKLAVFFNAFGSIKENSVSLCLCGSKNSIPAIHTGCIEFSRKSPPRFLILKQCQQN